jgi:hypothetical protein
MIKPFDAKKIHQKLEKLRRQGKAGAARAELLKPWPGMESDIRIIYDELLFEIRKNGTAPIFLKSFEIDEEADKFTYKMPDWWNAAVRRFSELYKTPEDSVRFEKANAVYGERMFLHFEGRSTLARDDIEDLLAECLGQEEIKVGTA